MAGLFDFLQGQGAEGVLPFGDGGNPFAGIGDNRNAILGYLAGALQGGTLGESIARGIGGMQQGSAMDEARRGREALAKYAGSIEAMPPELRQAVAANPQLAQAMIAARLKPHEYKFEKAGDYFGRFNPATGQFEIAGVSPRFEKVAPGETGSFVTAPIGTPGATPTIGASAVPVLSGGPEKPPAGYDYIDKSNPAAGLRAISGGPAFGDAAKNLRSEITQLPSYRNVAQAAPVYSSMRDASKRDDRASDVNLIYGMAKLMDPGSVVRESEMSVAQAIATLPQRLQSEIKSQLAATGRLPPEVRQGIMREAYSRMQAYRQMFDTDAAMYRGIASRLRIAHEDVIPSFGELVPPTLASGPKGDALKRRYGLE